MGRSRAEDHEVPTRYGRLWYHLQSVPNSSYKISNSAIERSLVFHPSTKFSLACDSSNLHAYVNSVPEGL